VSYGAEQFFRPARFRRFEVRREAGRPGGARPSACSTARPSRSRRTFTSSICGAGVRCVEDGPTPSSVRRRTERVGIRQAGFFTRPRAKCMREGGASAVCRNGRHSDGKTPPPPPKKTSRAVKSERLDMGGDRDSPVRAPVSLEIGGAGNAAIPGSPKIVGHPTSRTAGPSTTGGHAQRRRRSARAHVFAAAHGIDQRGVERRRTCQGTVRGEYVERTSGRSIENVREQPREAPELPAPSGLGPSHEKARGCGSRGYAPSRRADFFPFPPKRPSFRSGKPRESRVAAQRTRAYSRPAPPARRARPTAAHSTRTWIFVFLGRGTAPKTNKRCGCGRRRAPSTGSFLEPTASRRAAPLSAVRPGAPDSPPRRFTGLRGPATEDRRVEARLPHRRGSGGLVRKKCRDG